MDDGNPRKPVRPTTNRARDIFNTYIRHESGKQIPISSAEETSENVLENTAATEETGVKPTEQQVQNDELINEIEKLREEVKQLQSRVEQLEKEKAELYEQILRKAAEFENFRRRSQKEKEELIKYGNEKLLFEFLSLLDDLSNAVNSAKSNADFNALASGVELILNKAKKLFEQAGVTEIESPVGKPFNVDFHEALMTMPSELPEGYVVQELQKGYKFYDKVLRHTKVITSSGQTGGDGEQKYV
ncbi:nucleotide exchange factor GrpE [Bacteroidetes/Chlorobi group bacterium MS-B_bin-24]|nr:MAG: nucleotide exchange factor GrpE [Bacteroidetes/Chlorobi group bacterium MS-B_bin-24]